MNEAGNRSSAAPTGSTEPETGYAPAAVYDAYHGTPPVEEVHGYALAPAPVGVPAAEIADLADRIVDFRAELAAGELAAFDLILRGSVPVGDEADVELHGWNLGGGTVGRFARALGISDGEADRMFAAANARVSRRALIGGALGVAAAVTLARSGVVEASPTPGPAANPPAAPATAANFAMAARHGLTGAEYQAEFDKWVGQGYRPVRVSGYDVGGKAYYAAIFEKSPGPEFAAMHGISGAQYQTEFDKWTKQGYLPAWVNGYSVGGNVQYAALFERYSGPEYVARHGLSDADYAAEFKKNQGNGFRLMHVSGYAVGSQARYAAVWSRVAGPEQYTQHALSAADYQKEFDRLGKLGFRLVHVCGYVLNNNDTYAAIWAKGDGPDGFARHGVAGKDYQAVYNEWTGKGMRPADISGYSGGGAEKFAVIFQKPSLEDGDFGTVDGIVARYMSASSIPGVSIAIARRGALVYARGYGVANQQTGEKVTERTRFRIASISKPITSAAIFRLVEAGRLNLSDTVFGPNGRLGTTYGKNAYSDNLKKITVQHLLQHTSGGWPNKAGSDPMFLNPEMGHDELIGWTLDNQALNNAPGTNYAYSNFGFCLLGRVIERVSGQTYENYVRQNVLAPCGVSAMEIAGDTLAERKSGETLYYGADDVYTMKVRRMDSHGGWIATPTDLLRFALRVDGFGSVGNILRPETIATMTKASSANMPASGKAGYACGWAVNVVNNWWHDGALPGTATILVRVNNDVVWAAFANSRNIDTDKMMWEVHNAIAAWPSHDLF